MKCPKCGAEMIFDPALGKLRCEYCDMTAEPEELHSGENAPGNGQNSGTGRNQTSGNGQAHSHIPNADAEEADPDGDVYEATIYLCRSCGAELLVTDDTAVTFCSYCGSQSVLRSRVEEVKKPDFIIPFSQTKEDCEMAYRKMLRRSGFAPSSMTKDTTVEKFRGIYMPYWIYDMEAEGFIRTTGKQDQRHGDFIHHRYYTVSQEGRASYRGISFDASSSFADNLSQCIAPYDVSGGKPFNQGYLSGFYADMADVDADVYSSDARDIATAHAAGRLHSTGVYSRYGIDEKDLQYQIPMRIRNERMGLFPVWFLGCRSRDGKRISYAVVNGQTGKAAVELPVDFAKYLLGSLILAIPIFILLNLFLTLTPLKALLAAAVLGLASLLITNSQLDEIYTRENQLDDKGKTFSDQKKKSGGRAPKQRRQSENAGFGMRDLLDAMSFGQWWKGSIFVAFIALDFLSDTGLPLVVFEILIAAVVCVLVLSYLYSRRGRKAVVKKDAKFSMPFADKERYMIKQEAGIVIALAVLIADPASDLICYGSAAASMLLIVWTFYDLVKGHNRLTSRKLPQMGARGGDESDFG